MGTAMVVFHGRLQELLARTRRGAAIRRTFDGTPAVKDVLESLGVPHPEVEVVLVDGRPVAFEHRLRGGETVVAYPPGDAPAVPVAHRADPPSPPSVRPRFVLDGHLGRLAAYLRALGFDTLYRNDVSDAELASVVVADPGRILLTRDVGLLKRRVVQRGALVRADHPHEQLVEMAARFGLVAAARPFSRCMRCNGQLEPLERWVAETRVPARVFREQDAFRRCPSCDGVYWRGSHHRRMWRLFETLLPELGREGPPGTGG